MKLRYEPFNPDRIKMWGLPGRWVSSINHATIRMEHDVTLDRIECWYPECEELAVATYVDHNMLGHKYCRKHIAAFYEHLTRGESYCVHRIPYNFVLWDKFDSNISVPFCLPVGKCTYYPRGLSNLSIENNFPQIRMERITWQHKNKIYVNCGCNCDGYTFDGALSYRCAYADITDPVREKKRAEFKAEYAKKLRERQLSLFGGKK